MDDQTVYSLVKGGICLAVVTYAVANAIKAYRDKIKIIKEEAESRSVKPSELDKILH